MKLSSHVTFNGDCREAFQFYAELFGGEVETMMTWKDSPIAGQFPNDAVMHATLSIGSETIAGADAVGKPYQPLQGIYLMVDLHDVTEAERVFTALSDGGTIEMPLQQTFWAARYGMLRDRFGVPWEVNCGTRA